MMVCCGENIENYDVSTVLERNSVDLITAITCGRESAIISIVDKGGGDASSIFYRKKLLQRLSGNGFDMYLLRGAWKYCEEDKLVSESGSENIEDLLLINSTDRGDERTKLPELEEIITGSGDTRLPFLMISRPGIIYIVMQDGKHYMAAESVSAETIADSWWKVRQRANRCFCLQGILSPGNAESVEKFKRGGISYIG